MLKAVSRDTLTSQTAITLKRYILIEDLPVGTKLPSERELSEILVVSRNIVREALSALVAEKVVVKHTGKGTFVADFDRQATAISLPLTVNQDGTTAKDVP